MYVEIGTLPDTLMYYIYAAALPWVPYQVPLGTWSYKTPLSADIDTFGMNYHLRTF